MSCSRALNFLRIVFCVASAWTTMTHAQMPPAFDRILPPVDIDVNQATTLTLGQVSCLDPENNVTAVTLDPPLPSSPCGACFSVSNCPGSASDWCLTFDPVDRLDLTSVPEYTLVLTCEDADGLSDSMAVKVRVVKVAKPPVFVGLASVLTLVEKETQKLTMDTFNCTDPNDDQVKVSLGDVTPTIGKCASCFSVLPCGTEWCLVYLPSAGDLEFADTASYVVTVRCSDVDGNVTSSSVDVRLTTNSPPVFNISGMTDTHTVRNAKNVKAGATIYEVATYDPNPSDRVFYTMTSTPDNGNFDIGYSDGIIRASSDLSQECTSDVTFEVFADDRVNTPVGPFVVSVTLDGANQSPSITNMDETVQLEEEKAGDFYTIQVTDDGDVRDLAYTLAANPASALGFFSITSSKPPHLRVTGGLDYEDLSHRRVTLTLEAKDKGGCSTGVKRLIVEVTDVNEEPVFDHNPVTLTVYEGHITVADDKWKVLDPDAHESLSFALVKSSYPGMFGVDSKTGTIESLSDYDVDKNRMPDTVTLTLEVTDKGDLKDQTEVTLNVLDANDNRPKIRDVSKSFTVTECTSPGTVLGSLYVTDDDSSFQGNNQTYFRPTTSRPIAVLANGNVVLTSAMSAGATASISVYASDQGQYPGPLQSQGPAFVGVSAKVCPTSPPPPPPTPAPTPAPTTTTTTTTTAAPISVKQHDWMEENLPWIMTSALLGTMLLGLMGYMCWRYVRCPRPSCVRTRAANTKMVRSTTPLNQEQKPKPKPNKEVKRSLTPVEEVKQRTPASPPAPFIVGPQDAHLHDFWKEKYTEEDILSTPDRKAKPEPFKIDVGETPVTQDTPTTGGDAALPTEKTKTSKCAIL